jgi:hypothetical protein
MRDLARVGAALLAFVVIARDLAIAGDSEALRTLTYMLVFVVLGALTLWRDGAVTVSGLALAGHYVAALVYGHVQVDLAAPVTAALVVAYVDLADLATALPHDRRVDPAFARACLRRLGLVVGLGAAAGTVVYGLAAIPVPGGAAVRALGVVGVALAALAPVALTSRAPVAAPRQQGDRTPSGSG